MSQLYFRQVFITVKAKKKEKAAGKLVFKKNMEMRRRRVGTPVMDLSLIHI